MPKTVCHGCAEIQLTRVVQLSTRPDRTPDVAEKKYSAERERRSQYISTNCGKIFQVSRAAAPPPATRTVKRRPSRRRRRFNQARTVSATPTLMRDARE